MFEKMSLKSRLLLMATIPITVMLVLGISGTGKKYSDYQSRVQVESLVSICPSELLMTTGRFTNLLLKDGGWYV